MKKIKFVPLVALAVALSLFFASAALAQDQTGEVQNSPQVYVTKVTIASDTYKAGDTIHGTFELYNGSDISAGSMAYVLTLGNNFDTFGNPGAVLDTMPAVKMSLGAREKKVIPFSYVIPLSVEGDKVRIRVDAELPSGAPMGDKSSQDFSVTGGALMLVTQDAYIQPSIPDEKNPEKFELQAGVPIYKDNTPNGARAVFSFTSPTSEDVQVIPKINIFNRTVSSGSLKNSFSLPAVNIKSGKVATVVSFDVPTFDYSPGVYEGTLTLVDDKGLTRNEQLNFRYVVQGSSAIIQSVISDADFVNQGQQFNVGVSITGEAPDIYYHPEKSTSRNLRVVTEIKDGSGERVSSFESRITVGTGEVQLSIPMIAEKDASVLFASVFVYDGLKEIASYNEKLSSTEGPAVSSSDNVLESLSNIWVLIAIGALVLILLSIAAFKLSRRMFLSVLFIAIIGFGAQQVSGFTLSTPTLSGNSSDGIGLTDLQIFINSPIENQVFEPGAYLPVIGKTWFTNCFNRDTNALVQFFNGYGGSTPLQTIASISHLADKDKHSEDRQRNARDVGYGFVAPTTPGTYYAAILVQVNATGVKGTRRYGTYFTVTRVAYQPYIVRAPGTPGTGGGTGTGGTSSGTTTNGTTTITRECTPGVDCPDTDLGKIIVQSQLNPSYANSRTNTCPFFYTVGNEDLNRKISCALISNGRTTVLPKLQEDKTNGYPLSIGITNFVCSRSDGTSTTTESKTLTCNGNPNVTEH